MVDSRVQSVNDMDFINKEPIHFSELRFIDAVGRPVKARDKFMMCLYLFAKTYRRRRDLLEHGIGRTLYLYWEISYQFEYRGK